MEQDGRERGRVGPAPEARGALVLAPIGRDARLLVEALRGAAIPAACAASAVDLVSAVSEEVVREGAPQLGVLVVTADALDMEWAARLVDVLELQRPWSDLPIVLLAGAGGAPPAYEAAVAEILSARASVTVLDRPVRVASLLSAVRAALRARSRQVEVQELMDSRARALAEAEQANRTKGEFLAAMSHELRTPLNAIGGYVELMDIGVYGSLTDQQREALDRVNRAQRHLLGIINDLLNYARIERGQLQYQIEEVSLTDIVTEVAAMLEPQLTAAGLVWDLRLPHESVVVAADGEKLRQVLINLLSNAAKFTAPGGRVTLEVADGGRGEAGQEFVCVHISDTGIGIPAEKVESIFEPFVQLNREAWMRSQQGAGLGLAISRDMARAMGGELSARSTPGKGSTFTLTLPRHAEPPAGSLGTAPAPAAPAAPALAEVEEDAA